MIRAVEYIIIHFYTILFSKFPISSSMLQNYWWKKEMKCGDFNIEGLDFGDEQYANLMKISKDVF